MTSAVEEVAPVENYTIPRPSRLPVACAPTSASWRSGHESFVVTAAERAPLSQAHQVLIQAELALVLVTAGDGYGTTGFLGSMGADSASKRMTVGANGVPPRGRPV